MMNDYDGDSVYRALNEKIKTGQELTDADIMNLIFLPLMRNTIPRKELAVKSIELAQTIPDTNKRNACIAAAFASKYLSEAERDNLLEVLRMTDLAVMLVEDAVKDVAKKALREGSAIEFIKKITGLDEPTIKNLQVELQAK